MGLYYKNSVRPKSKKQTMLEDLEATHMRIAILFDKETAFGNVELTAELERASRLEKELGLRKRK